MALADTAKLVVDLSLGGNFQSGISKATKDLQKFDSAVSKSGTRAYVAGQQIGNGIKNASKLIVGASIVAGVALTGVFVKSVRAASDLSETISKVGVVFGQSAKQVLLFGKTAATSIGLSEQAADEAAATFGNLFVSMGLAQSKSAQMSVALTKLAGDLASFNNIDPAEALIALRAGLVGESEPLRRLGINLNEQTLKAEAVRLGLVKLTKGQKEYTAVLAPAVKAQAAYSLIFKQSKTAQGDYARTAGGLANQIRTLKAQFTTLAATLGTAVLPQVAKIFQKLNAELAKGSTVAAVEKLGKAFADLFTDENIQQGTKFLGNLFKTAVAAAPVLQATATATLKIVQAAVSLFTSLPPEIQALAAGAFAINKLTGGLVTNIGGALLDLVGKSRGSSPANPVYVSGTLLDGAGGGSKLLALGIAGAIVAAAVPIGQAFASVLPDWLKGGGAHPGESESQRRIREAREKQGASAPGAGLANPILDRGGREAGTPGFIGKITSQLRALTDTTKLLSNAFLAAANALKHAKTDLERRTAARQATGLVQAGRGNVENTSAVLAGLRKALHETHDPKTAALLRESIAKVERKLAGREFAARQIAIANKALADGKLTRSESAAVKRAVQALKDRGLPAAAAGIEAAVRKNRPVVTVNLPRPTVSIRAFTSGFRVATNFGGGNGGVRVLTQS